MKKMTMYLAGLVLVAPSTSFVVAGETTSSYLIVEPKNPGFASQ